MSAGRTLFLWLDQGLGKGFLKALELTIDDHLWLLKNTQDFKLIFNLGLYAFL